ncbi:MAG TPA: hypothetical protein VLH85_10280 [Levilinea sp.]|nr:hypothetical protein [Levilinea sp.]
MPEDDEVQFYDQEASYKLFIELEANADGWGAWRFMDTFGKPLIELPDFLRHDLLVWKRLKNAVERQHSKRKDHNG